jgi:hypothetical protein
LYEESKIKDKEVVIEYLNGINAFLFLHALETGLTDETIRAKMRPTLKNPSVADEDLIEAMSMAMSAKTERLDKFGASGRAKQASVSSLEMAKSNIKEKKEDGRVLAVLKQSSQIWLPCKPK